MLSLPAGRLSREEKGVESGRESDIGTDMLTAQGRQQHTHRMADAEATEAAEAEDIEATQVWRDQASFPKDDLEIVDTEPPLGRGHFGSVKAGKAKTMFGKRLSPWFMVTCKEIRDKSQEATLMKECRFHMRLIHPNIVDVSFVPPLPQGYTYCDLIILALRLQLYVYSTCICFAETCTRHNCTPARRACCLPKHNPNNSASGTAASSGSSISSSSA